VCVGVVGIEGDGLPVPLHVLLFFPPFLKESACL
jgi:hypothetical protein